MSSVSDMVGPTSMLVMGMLIAGINFEKIRSYGRLKMIVLLRLVICPVFVLILLFGISKISKAENTVTVSEGNAIDENIYDAIDLT